jgi:hypothetical protein
LGGERRGKEEKWNVDGKGEEEKGGKGRASSLDYYVGPQQ